MCSRHNYGKLCREACRWWFVDWTESCCLDEWATGTSSVSATGWEYLRVALSLTQSATTAWGSWFTGAGSVEKKLAQQTARVQAEHPEADVEVWTMDEHRLGLKPVLLDVGSRGNNRCSGELAFSVAMAVWLCSPSVGETYWWILPKVNINLFNRVLADFAIFGPGKNKQIILAMDQAGWHTSSQVEVPEGIHLEFMLPIHQNFNQQSVCGSNQWSGRESVIPDVGWLGRGAFQRCRALLKQQDLIRAWPAFTGGQWQRELWAINRIWY